MILNNKIKIKINPNSREYYNSVGYCCKNYDIIEVDVLDLSKGSNIEIEVKCDICGDEKK